MRAGCESRDGQQNNRGQDRRKTKRKFHARVPLSKTWRRIVLPARDRAKRCFMAPVTSFRSPPLFGFNSDPLSRACRRYQAADRIIRRCRSACAAGIKILQIRNSEARRHLRCRDPNLCVARKQMELRARRRPGQNHDRSGLQAWPYSLVK